MRINLSNTRLANTLATRPVITRGLVIAQGLIVLEIVFEIVLEVSLSLQQDARHPETQQIVDVNIYA